MNGTADALPTNVLLLDLGRSEGDRESEAGRKREWLDGMGIRAEWLPRPGIGRWHPFQGLDGREPGGCPTLFCASNLHPPPARRAGDPGRNMGVMSR